MREGVVAGLLVVCLAGEPAAGGEEAPPAQQSAAVTPAQIEQAIGDLSSPTFATRQLASELLWSAGPAAEAALERAVRSGDREVALRARGILEKFQLGIYPHTPAEVVEAVQAFRNGSEAAKLAACQTLLEYQQLRPLAALLRGERSEGVRRAVVARYGSQIQRHTSQMLEDGRWDEAQQWLEAQSVEDARVADAAVMLTLRGQLEQRLQQLLPDAERLPSQQIKLLCWLQRLRGDWVGARQAADRLRSPVFLWQSGILWEQSDWREMARLVELLFARSSQRNDESALQYYGLRASLQKRLGAEQAFLETVALIKQRGRSDPRLARSAAKVLLVNELAADALEVLAVHESLLPDRFRLLCAQNRYQEAFAAAGWRDGSERAAWLEGLVSDIEPATANWMPRFELALQVAEELELLGETEDASKLFTQLGRAAAEDPQGRRLQQLCQAEFQSHHAELAWRQIAEYLPRGADILPLLAAFPEQKEEATWWWRWLRAQVPSRPLAETLAQLQSLLAPSRTGEQAAADALARELCELAASQAGQTQGKERSQMFLVLGRTAQRHGQLAEAERYFAEVATTDFQAALARADQLRSQSDWSGAATWYETAARLNRGDSLANYLAGDAWQRAGREDLAHPLLLKGKLLPLAGESRHDLASGLQQRNLAAEAAEQWRLMLAYAAPSEQPYYVAAQQLANAISTTEALAASHYWERFFQQALLANVAFTEVESYLKLPHLIHKVRGRGLLEQGQGDEAWREFEQALSSLPGSYALVEDIVPLLEQAGRKDDADALFQRVFAHCDRICREYPRSGHHANNLAWLAARTQRQLSRALELATAAVESDADNASFLDTLAEVHFRLGHRDEALKYSRRSLELEPDNEHFRQQLTRFAS